ncbi:hypothetical protein [Halospeciosus flavus]|uniref:hypothetical protein n=1 Tax=Halospeciosus flavus TaxID=3032283 RepID=UPI003614A777
MKGSEAIEKLVTEIVPNLSITTVSARPKSSDHAGQLAVEVKNTGTGPSWIHQITYDGAPNFAANDDLSEDPGVHLLSEPNNREDSIIAANERRSYIGTSPPLIYPENGSVATDCTGEVHLTVFAGTGTGSAISADILVRPNGEASVIGSFGDFTCSAAEITKERGSQ